MDIDFKATVKEYKHTINTDIEQLLFNKDPELGVVTKKITQLENTLEEYLIQKHIPPNIYLSHSNGKQDYVFERFSFLDGNLKLSYTSRMLKSTQFPENITITNTSQIEVSPIKTGVTLPQSQKDALHKFYNKKDIKLLQ